MVDAVLESARDAGKDGVVCIEAVIGVLGECIRDVLRESFDTSDGATIAPGVLVSDS